MSFPLTITVGVTGSEKPIVLAQVMAYEIADCPARHASAKIIDECSDWSTGLTVQIDLSKLPVDAKIINIKLRGW